MTPHANTYSSRIELPLAAPLTMSSREIAELCGKEHKNVLADVRKMLLALGIQPAEFSARYIDAKGESRECFDLPKRETMILVSGYSVELRAKIVDRWMELEGQQKPMTPAETLLEQARFMVAVERRQLELEAAQQEQAATIAQTVTRLNQIETATDHFTVLGYARWVRKDSIDFKRASDIGRRASRRARDLGVKITKVPDPRFGAVAQYPKAILDFVWDEYFPALATVQ